MIKVAGTCVPSITAEYMLDGTIQVFYLWDPIKLGYITYYAAKLPRRGQDRRQARQLLRHRRRQQVAGHYDRRHGEIVTGEPLQYTEANYKEHKY